MKQIKVSEATPIQLDWLVAKCEGHIANIGHYGKVFIETPGIDGDEYFSWSRFEPASSWDQGGPIIERERLCARPLKEVWGCWVTDKYGDIHALALSGFGPTPLIAAMRCYVCSVMGEIAEIPEELE